MWKALKVLTYENCCTVHTNLDWTWLGLQDQSSHWLAVRQGRVSKTPNHVTQDAEDYISGRARPSHKGRPGYPDPEIRGGGSEKRFFAAFRASVWSKNNGEGGGAGGRAPPPDPSLKSNMIYARIRTDPVCQFSNLRGSPEQNLACTAPTPCTVHLGRKVLTVPTQNYCRRQEEPIAVPGYKIVCAEIIKMKTR